MMSAVTLKLNKKSCLMSIQSPATGVAVLLQQAHLNSDFPTDTLIDGRR